MLSTSSQRISSKKPINLDELLDPEELDSNLVMDWLRHGKSKFSLGKDDQILVHSLSDPDSRKKMMEQYAPHILGFEKKPDVTLKEKKEINGKILELLQDFKLPTKYPARKNLPVPPPNASLHSTGLLAESALMLYNQILTPFIKTMTIIKYYSITNGDLPVDHIIEMITNVIEKNASTAGISGRQAALNAVQEIKSKLSDMQIDTKIMAEHYAKDLTSGNFAKFPYAVAAVKEILSDVESYVYLRDTLKHMYVLMVNEYKVYQKYDENQQIFKQAENQNIKADSAFNNSIIITGAVIPSGVAQSNTIKPVDRPMISEDNQTRMHHSETLRMEGDNVINMDIKKIHSGARYRLICDKDKYTLSASDRYAPQLFLKMKYVMDMDIEFGLDLKTAEAHIYRVNKPTKNAGLYLNTYPYDPGVITNYQNRIKFAINNGLGNVQKHLAYIYEDTYSQCDPKYDCIHGPYQWFGDQIVRSEEYNILAKPRVKIKMDCRTDVLGICDADHTLQFIMPKPLDGPDIEKDEKVHFGLPDYRHYNYAYQCAYDINNIQETSIKQSRQWYRVNKNKFRAGKWRRYVALINDVETLDGEIIEY